MFTRVATKTLGMLTIATIVASYLVSVTQLSGVGL